MRTTANIRLVHDPRATARFQIQEEVDDGLWISLRMFSNESEARTAFNHIKEYGLGVSVLETAKAPVT